MSVSTIRQLKAQRAALLLQRGDLSKQIAALDLEISRKIDSTFAQFKVKPAASESYVERQDRLAREASPEDRLRKPAGMDWGTYYKTL